MRHRAAVAGRGGQRLRARAAGRLAPRLDAIDPPCTVWLVATGAEERIYTGSPDHLGALALRDIVPRRRLRYALSLDEVGRGASFRPALARVVRRASGSSASCWRPPRRPACRSTGSATRAPATPTTASSSSPACAASSSACHGVERVRPERPGRRARTPSGPSGAPRSHAAQHRAPEPEQIEERRAATTDSSLPKRRGRR